MLRRSFVASLPCAMTLGFPAIVRAKPSYEVGLSLPLTGVQSAVGKEMLDAYQLAFEEAGRPFSISVLDDGSDVNRAVENFKEFSSGKRILMSSGIVGTPHALAVLPVIKDAKLPVIGIRSGASVLRSNENPIWHLRATFEDEISFLVKDAKSRMQESLAIVYSDDAFGKGSKDWMISEMNRLGLKELITLPVDRDGSNVDEVCKKVSAAIVTQSKPVSVALLMITKPMIQAAKSLRLKYAVMNPIIAMSFTANRSVSTEPDSGLAGLAVVTAFPLPRTSNFSGSVQYRKEIERAGRLELADSFTSYEAWFYAKAMLAMSGAESRDEIAARLPRDIRGAGFGINFDSSRVGYRHIGLAYKSQSGRLREIV